MSHAIRKRIQKLESQIVPEPKPIDKARLCFINVMRVFVAYYLGNPGPLDSIASAHARALGYEDWNQCEDAMSRHKEDFLARMHQANLQLFSKFGLDWNDEPVAFVQKFRRMADDLPEHYKQSLHNIARQNGVEWEAYVQVDNTSQPSTESG